MSPVSRPFPRCIRWVKGCPEGILAVCIPIGKRVLTSRVRIGPGCIRWGGGYPSDARGFWLPDTTTRHYFTTAPSAMILYYRGRCKVNSFVRKSIQIPPHSKRYIETSQSLKECTWSEANCAKEPDEDVFSASAKGGGTVPPLLKKRLLRMNPPLALSQNLLLSRCIFHRFRWKACSFICIS